MRNSAYQGLLRTTLLFVLGIVASAALSPGIADARPREADRFGIRGGIWPQSDIVGKLGATPLTKGGDTLSVRIDEGARALPFIEVFGNFHLGGFWWADGSIGWAGRNDVQVGGFGRGDAVLLGNGRVDFFPMYVGMRAVKTLGSGERPHNVYLRGGGSVVFANESPDLVQDSVLKYGLYTAGTEGAFGYLVATGGEYYVGPTIAFNADISYRYTKFSYGREAKFDLSSFWLAIGITVKTR